MDSPSRRCSVTILSIRATQDDLRRGDRPHSCQLSGSRRALADRGPRGGSGDAGLSNRSLDASPGRNHFWTVSDGDHGSRCVHHGAGRSWAGRTGGHQFVAYVISSSTAPRHHAVHGDAPETWTIVGGHRCAPLQHRAKRPIWRCRRPERFVGRTRGAHVFNGVGWTVADPGLTSSEPPVRSSTETRTSSGRAFPRTHRDPPQPHRSCRPSASPRQQRPAGRRARRR